MIGTVVFRGVPNQLPCEDLEGGAGFNGLLN